MKYYIAYGSNLSHEQMKHRCPSATPVGTAALKGWRLVFKYHADIIPHENGEVPVGIWQISDEDESRLDKYEGYPGYYVKRNMYVMMKTLDGRHIKRINAFVYVMSSGHQIYPPEISYYHGIMDGYEDFGLNTFPLLRALDNSLMMYKSYHDVRKDG